VNAVVSSIDATLMATWSASLKVIRSNRAFVTHGEKIRCHKMYHATILLSEPGKRLRTACDVPGTEISFGPRTVGAGDTSEF
jgi:hypothetical protein